LSGIGSTQIARACGLSSRTATVTAPMWAPTSTKTPVMYSAAEVVLVDQRRARHAAEDRARDGEVGGVVAAGQQRGVAARRGEAIGLDHWVRPNAAAAYSAPVSLGRATVQDPTLHVEHLATHHRLRPSRRRQYLGDT
jgi:hypothetical protein